MCTVSVNVCVFDVRVLQCHSPLGSKASHSHTLLLPGYPQTSRCRLVLLAYFTRVNLKMILISSGVYVVPYSLMHAGCWCKEALLFGASANKNWHFTHLKARVVSKDIGWGA